ncbi:autophagy-related protein 16 [Xylogone sp. PMI_703]|nr:autophagy-related protein 16 [Xylogone sp. PMI_703]
MISWREEYLQALDERDKRERASFAQVNNELIAAFTELLDRTAALEAEKAARITASGTTSNARDDQTTATDGNAQLRSDLAQALRSNGQLQARLKTAEAELVKLRAKTKADSELVKELSGLRATLTQKVRDRDEELRGKAKLLDDVQDEMISLNLQLNMVEQRCKSLESENKELIARWMAHKSREADEMNKTLK